MRFWKLVDVMKMPVHQIFLVMVTAAVLSLAASSLCEARLVRDPSGREVSVPDNPERVVSLAPSITEIIFALGEEHRLKGVTQYCNFPQEAESLPKVGSFVRPDLEKIVALTPDLCLVTRDGNSKDPMERLEALKVPVYVVNPKDLETVMETLLEIGGLLNVGPKAQKLANEMHDRIEGVKSRIAQAKQRPGVFFEIGVAPIVSVGTNTFIHELITTAGGHNLAEGPIPYPRFSREQVLALEPEIIIITSMTRGLAFEQVKEEWNRWDSLPAVRNRRIHIVESDLFDRPSMRLADGLELLARLIHPELW